MLHPDSRSKSATSQRLNVTIPPSGSRFGGKLSRNCLNRGGAAFPEKLHVGTLYFDVGRIGREREDAIHSFDGIWPVAYSEIGLCGIVERNRIARIDCFSFLVRGDGLGQVSLPALHRSNVETDIAIIRKNLRCRIQFAQSFL